MERDVNIPARGWPVVSTPRVIPGSHSPGFASGKSRDSATASAATAAAVAAWQWPRIHPTESCRGAADRRRENFRAGDRRQSKSSTALWAAVRPLFGGAGPAPLAEEGIPSRPRSSCEWPRARARSQGSPRHRGRRRRLLHSPTAEAQAEGGARSRACGRRPALMSQCLLRASQGGGGPPRRDVRAGRVGLCALAACAVGRGAVVDSDRG